MKKKALLTFSALLLATLIVFGIISIIGIYNERKQEKLKMDYKTQNSAFSDIVHTDTVRDMVGYLPINLSKPNVDGVVFGSYISLALYRRETGSSLTYEQVIAYLSQEFEDDGEIRIFTNGRHPEISDYVKWIDNRENWSIYSDFRATLGNEYSRYAYENRPFPRVVLFMLPLEMVDELIKKAFDPEYEMDLTSIQNRYIAEGRAVVSEDGRSIVFIVPES